MTISPKNCWVGGISSPPVPDWRDKIVNLAQLGNTLEVALVKWFTCAVAQITTSASATVIAGLGGTQVAVRAGERDFKIAVGSSGE